MMEDAYLCQQCRHVFRVPPPDESPQEKELSCPQCGSSQIERLPSWAPVGYDFYQGPPVWEYECQHCHNTFTLPVPSSPSQEKEIRCPQCRGEHIHNLSHKGVFQPLCGG